MVTALSFLSLLSYSTVPFDRYLPSHSLLPSRVHTVLGLLALKLRTDWALPRQDSGVSTVSSYFVQYGSHSHPARGLSLLFQPSLAF